MNSDKGRINYQIGLDNSVLRAQATETTNILKGISRSAIDEGSNIDATFKRLEKTIAGAFSATAAVEFAQKVVSVRSEIESLEISFKTLLGSEEKANAMFGEIRKFAVETPMQLKDLASAAQLMLSFDIEESKIVPYLKALGDVSMGDSQRFQSLALAFSQMSSAGKLMGQDYQQLISAGFNPLAQMAEKSGKSLAILKDEMSAGKISAEMVQQAFIDATSEGGKFYGMLESQSKGLRGSLSNLQGAIDDMLNDIGTSSQGVMSGVINTATGLVKNYKEVAEVIMAVVATYGTYKAAVMVNEAIAANVSAQVVASYQTEIDAINALLVAKTEETSASIQVETADLQEAVAKGVLTKAQADEVAATRIALAHKRESLIIAEKEAAAEVSAAEAKVAASTKKVEAAQAELAIARKKAAQAAADTEIVRRETIVAMEYGTAKEKAAAADRIQTAALNQQAAVRKASIAQQRLETAQTELQTAEKAKATAASNLHAASQAKESLITNTDTVSKGANTAATNILTSAKKRLSATCKKLWGTMSANPYAIVLAAVVALGYGIYKLITYENEAEKAAKNLKKANEECENTIASEKAQVDILFGALKGATKGTKEYNDAKEAIIKKYGVYIQSLSEEIASLKDVEAAYDAVTRAVERTARARAMDTYTEKATSNYGAKYGEKAAKIRNELIDKYGNKKGTEYYIKLKPVIEGQKQLTDLSKELQDVVNSFDELHARATGLGPSDTYKTNVIKESIAEIYDAKKVMDDTLQEARDIFGDGGVAEDPKEDAPVVKNRKYWEDLKKDLQGQLDAMSSAEKNSKKAIELRKKIAEAQTEIDSYNVSKSSAAYSKQETEAQRMRNKEIQLSNSRLKQQQEQARQEREFAIDIEQARIDGMDEGFVKVIAQNKLNWEKLQEANIRRKEEYIEQLRDLAEAAWKQSNPKDEFDRSTISDQILDDDFDITGLSDEMQQLVKTLRNQLGEYERIAAETHARANDEALQNEKDTMNAYLAEFGSYLERRSALEEEAKRKTEKAVTQGERMSIMAKLQKDLDDLDFQQFVKKDADLAFGEVDKLSQRTIAHLIEQLEKYKSKVMQTFDPDKINKYNEALSRLRKAQALNSDNVMANFIPKYFRERIAAQKELNELEHQSDELTREKAKKENEVKLKIDEIINKVMELTGKELTAKQLTDGTLQNIIGELVQRGDTEEANKLQNSLGKLGNLSVELNGVSEAAEEAEKNYSSMLGAFNTQFGDGPASALDKIGEIVHGINDAVQGAKALVDELAETAETFGADTSEGSGWNNATTFMGGFAEASQGATDAFESFKSGNPMGVINGVVKSFTGWIKAFNAIHDAKYEKQIKNLQERIEELDIAYDQLNRAVDKAYSKEASKLLAQQNSYLHQQRLLVQQQLQAEQAKKDTDKDRVKDLEAQLRELNNAIEDNKDKMVDAIFGQDIKEAINDFTDAYAAMFDNGLSRTDSAKNFVKGMIKSMITEAIKAETSPEMVKFRDMMTQFWTKGYITTAEEDIANSFIENLMKNVEAKYGWADKYFEAESNREGSSKGIETASQDSIDELNARMTTIQGHTYSLSENTKILVSTAGRILESVVNIDRNTGVLSDRVATVETVVKDMRNTLNDITMKGIKII